MLLNGKNAFVTGATRGLGREISIFLASVGCNIYTIGRDEKKLLELQESLGESSLGYSVCNLENVEEIKNTAQKCLSVNDIDILINCAGIFPVSTLEESSIAMYNKCFNVNVRAPFVLCKILSERMKERKWGRIVNICSSSSYAGFKETSIYCASKHALLGLTRSLYDELKEEGIRVYSVSPGSIQTSMGLQVRNQDYDTFMRPEEIADFIVKIISYDSNMISEEIRLNRVLIR